MVNHSDRELDAIFSALADPTRRAILDRLSRGDTSVMELAQPFDMSLPAISKHLTVLESAGLILREKQGRVRRCHLEAGPLRNAAQWLSHYRAFWADQLDALDEFLSRMPTDEDTQGDE